MDGSVKRVEEKSKPTFEWGEKESKRDEEDSLIRIVTGKLSLLVCYGTSDFRSRLSMRIMRNSHSLDWKGVKIVGERTTNCLPFGTMGLVFCDFWQVVSGRIGIGAKRYHKLSLIYGWWWWPTKEWALENGKLSGILNRAKECVDN